MGFKDGKYCLYTDAFDSDIKGLVFDNEFIYKKAYVFK